jgi:excisionase family DNA binding protein
MLNVLTVADLAERLRIGRSSAYKLVSDGDVRSIRVGRVIRIPAEAVEQFLKGDETAETIAHLIGVEPDP